MNKLRKITNKFTGEIRPDESANSDEFIRQYALNPIRWDKAFSFLEETDLLNLAKGRHELEGNNLYASVDEYLTKNEENARYETHRRYADIQYVISGEEMIGIIPQEKTEVTTPYDEEKDICFLKSDENIYRHATPGRFFIFFPEDAHKPCVKMKENTLVKKIVIKVRI